MLILYVVPHSEHLTGSPSTVAGMQIPLETNAMGGRRPRSGDSLRYTGGYEGRPTLANTTAALLTRAVTAKTLRRPELRPQINCGLRALATLTRPGAHCRLF